MKKIFLSAAILLSAFTAQAGETIILKKTVKLAVDLSTTGIRSSNLGYGDTYFVKILVPGLAAETLLNHRNEGESAPCLATYETFKVEDVVQNNPTTELHDFEIVQKKVTYPNETDKTCAVYLIEDVSTKVRGFNFVHQRTSELPSRHIDDCQ
ncbi:hypothetical protein [Pseudobdellovibrio sp. HCB154]|uniref:hypothetical protein n=1 Tax=Pseudobdellovibrio sp. HCB154 TaxID=3386277 RepID=UPI003916EFDB